MTDRVLDEPQGKATKSASREPHRGGPGENSWPPRSNSFSRTMGYLREGGWRGNRLEIQTTGANVKVTRTFLRDFTRGLNLYLYLVAAGQIRRLGGNRRPERIFFAPQQAAPWYLVWSACQWAGIRIAGSIEDADLVFHFDDNTRSDPLPFSDDLKTHRLLNDKCIDVSKERVDRIFEETFGYSVEVDPTVFQGPAVCKSNKNGAHDGRILQCPIEADRQLDDHVYQKLIENTQDDRTVQDIRVPVVGGQIPFVYIKHRRIEERFTNNNFTAEFREADELLSKAEQGQITSMANAMGLDFGGLDVLRHRDDGRIYVVDVNKTDMGPPTALPFRYKVEAVKRLAKAFTDFLDGLESKSP